MDFELARQVILITGAGSGIGQAIALAFAKEGAQILVNDLDEEHCGETIAMLRQLGARAHAEPFDVSDLAAVRAAGAGIAARHGGVDVLVNNAAVLLANQLFVDTDPADCDREIKVGLYGTLHCSRVFLPNMIARGAGKVINIVSDAARVGQQRESTYSCAKGGVISFTKSLAREVGGHGITVNAVSPAATDTPLRQAMLRSMAEKLGEAAVASREEKIRRAYPLKKIGTGLDVANAVVFLASAAAGHVTGQVISVNGGYVMGG